MIGYISRKLLYSISVLFGIVTVVFLLFAALPGDPARLMLGQRADQSEVEMIRKDLGLDQPLLTQYFVYLNDLSPLAFYNLSDSESAYFFEPTEHESSKSLWNSGSTVLVLKAPYLRRSYQSQQTVVSIVLEALPGTAVLAVTSIIIATFLGITFGIFGALFKGQWLDKLLMVFSIFGMSLPSFVAAILIMWVFAYLLGSITGLEVTGSLYEIDEFEGKKLVLKNLILPAITLGVRPLAVFMQLTRNSMLEVLSMDYVRTATAKGLSFKTVVLKHALRNALNPVITAISGWLASLLAGAVFVEIVFGWKGLGLIMLNALNTYDLPVVMGCIILVAVIFVVINMLVDVLYGIFDPRVSIG
ncbi:MAG: ABC transporter permease [Flavobacteriales bacterium]|nr:ABC transporter permease [Flavobacteriales bacterium]